MKYLYIMAVACLCLMVYVVYLVSEREEIEQQKTVATTYNKQCARFGGTTYIVDDIEEHDVALCVDTDVFLLRPKELTKNDKNEINKKSGGPRPGNN